MQTVSVTEAKNKLSALLTKVRAGESVLILDRGVPVARLEPVAGDGDDAAKVARLQRAGLVRAGAKPMPLHLLLSAPPKPKDGADIVEALLEERRTGR